MEKRSYERVAADVDVRFSHGYMFYRGNITNISERGLFIKTGNCLAENSLLLVMFRVEDNLL